MTTTKRVTGVAVSLALVLAAGMATAADPARPASGLSGTQKLTAAAAFEWLPRDAGLLTGDIAPLPEFREAPGLREKQGRMVAKVRDRTDMAARIASEAAASPVALRGVNQNQGFGALWAQADQRIAEARARLAPSLLEAHTDVDVHAFTLPVGWTEEQLAAVLMATGDYEYVEPDWLVYPTDTTPNDPLFAQQWYHRAINMNTVRAWDYATGGPDIIVAVCDTGVRKSHPDLTTFVPGFNATSNLAEVDGGNTDDTLNGHGTLVAGCMSARGNNGVGIAGTGWNFSIMPIKVSDRSDGTASLSDILQGARWAADNGAFAVNCSYGGSNSSQANTSGNYIRGRDALLVFSSGNDGVQDQNFDWPTVTIVGATDSSNSVTGFSNYGGGIDVVAPGQSIRSTTRTGGYASVTGTSFSSPLTAATMALIRAADPSLTADEVEQLLFVTARDIGAPGEDNFSGNGLVDAGAAVEAALFGPDTVDLPFTDDFEGGEISNRWREPVGSPQVNDTAGSMALNLDASDSLRTVSFRASVLIDGVGEISFDAQHRGVEAGETLLVEFTDIIGNWQPLVTLTSDGVDSDSFERTRMAIPLFGVHNELKVRFTAQGNDTTDDWYIDNIRVAEFEGNIMPWQTGFEDGIDTTFDWETAQATVTTSAQNIPEGDQAARLSGSAVMLSRPIDTTAVTTIPYFRVRTQHVGVEAGKALLVEYRDILGNWQTLETIVSDGQDQNAFELHQIALPFAAFGPELAIRLTAGGTDPSDVWNIDDVAVTEDFVVDPPSCPQDIDNNGSLNFFDISGFLALFNTQDASADWDNNGLWNFFDISEYLADFNAGCP